MSRPARVGPATKHLETEIKLFIPGAVSTMRRAVRALDFKVARGRALERNILFDTVDFQLRRRGEMIRLRRVGTRSILTLKGPSIPGPHKSREELESEISDPETMELILARLRLLPLFRYEKFREEFQRLKQHGTITLDQTPIGNFLELEGVPQWIDRTARELGFARSDYITASYGNLYLSHCRALGLSPSDMVFGVDRTL